MADWKVKILFDGNCPFCRLEARWLQVWNRRERLAFEDIFNPNFDPQQYGLTRDEVVAVIHGVLPDGRVVRGVEVFRQAYSAVGLGWLLAPTAWPIARRIADFVYAAFARFRIPLGRLLGRGCAAGSCVAVIERPIRQKENT